MTERVPRKTPTLVGVCGVGLLRRKDAGPPSILRSKGVTSARDFGSRDYTLRHSQLAPCSFQYTSSTPPGFATEIQSDKVSVLKISVRLKLKPNEQDKSQTVVFQFVIGVQLVFVPSARSPHGVFHGRPGAIRRPPARLSYRGPPQPAPELCGSRRCFEGPRPGLSVVGGANRGETSGKAARGSRGT